MSKKSTHSIDDYRKIIFDLVEQLKDNPKPNNLQMIRAIAFAAQTDKQLEDLQKIHERVLVLEDLVKQMTKTRADVRHGKKSRLDE